MGLTAYFLRKIMEASVLLSPSNFPPAALYGSLHTADPGETGTSEHSGGGYARVLCPSFIWDAGDLRVENGAAVDWTTGASATFTHWGLWDASSAGNFLAYGQLLTPIVWTGSGIMRFPAGFLTIKISNAT
jgi:hypothetical protein